MYDLRDILDPTSQFKARYTLPVFTARFYVIWVAIVGSHRLYVN